MPGLQTLAKYGWLSDEQRWDVQRYQFDWASELDARDCEIIQLLDCLSDGEFSGLASVAQFFDLAQGELKNGFSEKLMGDWLPFIGYVNIIVYEELRHGMALGSLFHFVTTKKNDYFSSVDIRDLSSRAIWSYDKHRYWDMYSFGLAHLFAEVVNVELYRDVAEQVTHPQLKALMLNIMKDEARHTAAWLEIFKDIMACDPEHKRRALQTLDRALLYHNAMMHDRYFEGLNKMLPLFVAREGEHKSAVHRIAQRKHKILMELFAEESPYTEKDVINMHMQFLARSVGKNRAQFSESAPGNIEFHKL
jgi:hypothetical protein